MPIKADRWIKKMALEHNMIEPFVDGQVREGVISYGLTSYGYDMRVTNQFKVFTNVYNVLVDPKNFNPRSFVDIEADYIDIPPNSFALAQSMEHFRIPRKVSCIVIGKSSYARCFRGDTRVALVDGTAPTLEAMARRSEHGELFWGYSIGQHGRVIVTMLESPRYIGRDSLLEVVLDTGEPIHCTPDHQFLMRDRQLREAGALRPGDALMPLYRNHHRGYAMVYQPLNSFEGMRMRNHKVASVRELPGDHDVYCLTVPEAGNFALEAGVFVRNCGIIVNVTPLEPEWHGYVTIEISNTTPLPARIYANEGIGQVLFLESDEECEVSYADKKGKYQGQQGIVLPRIDREQP